MIEVSHVAKAYGPKVALDDVTIEARDGALTYLLGPNGAGKTTLLRMIAGLARPDAGVITIDGRAIGDLRTPGREIGFGLNAFARHPKHTALQHLRWQADLAGIDRAEVHRTLELVGLAPVASRLVGKFSFGMLQRLGIAGALLGDPQTVVLDEPANGLDVEGSLWLRGLLTDLAAQGRCLLVASHSLAEVEITASRIVIMGEGRVLSDASLEDTLVLGRGPRRLESAYLEITAGSVEYSGSKR